MKKPKEINILGKIYKIIYVDNPAEVDIHRRESLWGQVDYWTRTIRIYDNGRNIEDIWESIIHESLHAIASLLKIKLSKEENVVDLLAMGLTDMLFRNKLINLK